MGLKAPGRCRSIQLLFCRRPGNRFVERHGKLRRTGAVGIAPALPSRAVRGVDALRRFRSASAVIPAGTSRCAASGRSGSARACGWSGSAEDTRHCSWRFWKLVHAGGIRSSRRSAANLRGGIRLESGAGAVSRSTKRCRRHGEIDPPIFLVPDPIASGDRGANVGTGSAPVCAGLQQKRTQPDGPGLPALLSALRTFIALRPGRKRISPYRPSAAAGARLLLNGATMLPAAAKMPCRRVVCEDWLRRIRLLRWEPASAGIPPRPAAGEIPAHPRPRRSSPAA